MNYSFGCPITKSKIKLFTTTGNIQADDKNPLYSIIWNKGEDTSIEIDGIIVPLTKNCLITLTPSHKFKIRVSESVVFLQFNEEFYCVEKHDFEIGCVGIIFYGTMNLVSLPLSEVNTDKFKLLLDFFVEEFQNKDNIQREMLNALLKRLIIKCTRIARELQFTEKISTPKYELIRQYIFLVEKHFKEFQNVGFYAEELNKSPKTLSNLFAIYDQPSPITIIHNRILKEAKRQLLLTDKSIKEIAYELNFNDIQSFSRFFRNKEGISPNEYRKSLIC